MKATQVTSHVLVATFKDMKGRKKRKISGRESGSNNLFHSTKYTLNVSIYHVTGFHGGVRTGSVLQLEPSSAGPSQFQVLMGPAHLLALQWRAWHGVIKRWLFRIRVLGISNKLLNSRLLSVFSQLAWHS